MFKIRRQLFTQDLYTQSWSSKSLFWGKENKKKESRAFLLKKKKKSFWRTPMEVVKETHNVKNMESK